MRCINRNSITIGLNFNLIAPEMKLPFASCLTTGCRSCNFAVITKVANRLDTGVRITNLNDLI
jgi:hypothetical protein